MKFHELQVGDRFTVADQPGVVYTRINDNRISCCKVFNAQNPENKQVFIVPASEVEKVE